MDRLGAALLALLVIGVLGFVAACEVTAKVESTQGTDEISYRWDANKELCFGMIASSTYYGYRTVSIAYVPLMREKCN